MSLDSVYCQKLLFFMSLDSVYYSPFLVEHWLHFTNHKQEKTSFRHKRAKIEGDKDVSFDATFIHELLSMPLRLSVLLTICLKKNLYN